MRRVAFYSTVFLASLAIVSCSSDDGGGEETPACQQTLCESGEAICLGNVAATCASDGRGYTLNDCGSALLCSEGECTPRACPFVGQTKCKDGKTLQRCSEDGSELTEEPCDADTQCRAGACLPVACTADEVHCGFREFATCNASGNGWTPVTPCSGPEICVDGACTAQTCDPEARRCKDAMTMEVCKLDGTGWEETTCGDGTECDDSSGSCLPKLCEATSPVTDTVGGDGGSDGSDGTDGTDGADGADVPDVMQPKEITNPLQPKDEAEVTIDGEKIEFSVTVSANYVAAMNDLRISMNKGQSKIEISITPIEEFDIGVYDSEEQTDTNVQIFYHDGSPLVGMAQFRYTSVAYEVELIKFEAKDGRVKGTFSGTFTDDGGATTIPFTDGSFDVKRHN